MISSAKKTTGCEASTCCQLKNINDVKKENKKVKTEPASLSLFFFNI
jgi:hypothetical protein